MTTSETTGTEDQPRRTAAAYAALWAAKHPEMAERIARAVLLAGRVRQVGRCTYNVSGSCGVLWTVHVLPALGGGLTSTCNCPDARLRGSHCKHRLAVALHVKTR